MNGLTWWFAALTVAGIVAFSWELSLALATLKWPTVEGRVLRSFAKDTGGESPSWEVVIEYEYVVGGLPYRSRKLRYGLNRLMMKDWAQAVAAKRRPGDSVSVWYDPAKPSRAVLRPGGHVGLTIALIITCVAGPAMVLAFRGMK
jgi:hypothetical protein